MGKCARSAVFFGYAPDRTGSDAVTGMLCGTEDTAFRDRRLRIVAVLYDQREGWRSSGCGGIGGVQVDEAFSRHLFAGVSRIFKDISKQHGQILRIDEYILRYICLDGKRDVTVMSRFGIERQDDIDGFILAADQRLIQEILLRVHLDQIIQSSEISAVPDLLKQCRVVTKIMPGTSHILKSFV